MGYQPRIRSPKGAIHDYKKPLREKRKDRKHFHQRPGRPVPEEKHIATEREVSDATLKRLHTLGIQKFGSSPFNEHFVRWLTNVTAVLDEFKSNPNIGVDEQFETDCIENLSTIKRKLDGIARTEASLGQEANKLSDWRTRLKQINKEYAVLTGRLKGQRNREIKRLNKEIERLKKDQDMVIRIKTGFFHGISKKKRERKEMAVIQELNDKQTELELVVLNFRNKQVELRADYDKKREPVLEEIKKYRRLIKIIETDGSLEERWFACEALIDAVNSFQQRKAIQKGNQPKNRL